jgi:hypothetical protein
MGKQYNRIQYFIPTTKIKAVNLYRDKQNVVLVKHEAGLAGCMLFHIWFRLFARLNGYNNVL